MIKTKALRDFISPVYGNVDTGQIVNLPPDIASLWAGAGMVEIVELETKPLVMELEVKRRGRKPKNGENNHTADE